MDLTSPLVVLVLSLSLWLWFQRVTCKTTHRTEQRSYIIFTVKKVYCVQQLTRFGVPLGEPIEQLVEYSRTFDSRGLAQLASLAVRLPFRFGRQLKP